MAGFESQEKPPLVTGRTWDDYYTNMHKRVHEEDMDTSVDYSLIAQMVFSQYGEIAEFQTRLARVGLTEEMGRASLILCIIDPETNDAMGYLESDSVDGIITPLSQRRLSHHRVQGIGAIEAGYLIGPDAALVPQSAEHPHELTASAYANDPNNARRGFFVPTDTRTSSLELQGIYLGRD